MQSSYFVFCMFIGFIRQYPRVVLGLHKKTFPAEGDTKGSITTYFACARFSFSLFVLCFTVPFCRFSSSFILVHLPSPSSSLLPSVLHRSSLFLLIHILPACEPHLFATFSFCPFFLSRNFPQPMSTPAPSFSVLLLPMKN